MVVLDPFAGDVAGGVAPAGQVSDEDPPVDVDLVAAQV